MTQTKKTDTEPAEEAVFLRRRVAELEKREASAVSLNRLAFQCIDRLSALVRAFDGYIYVCSQDYRIEFMNEPLIHRTGYDATGDLCFKALHDRDAICPWCVNDRVFAGETVRWQVQSPKDGRWYHVVNTPYYNEGGALSKQALMIDVTDRQQDKDALLETREKYHELIENASCIILKLDAEGRISFINEYGQQFFDYPGTGLLGRSIIGTILPDTAANRQGLAQLMERLSQWPNRPVKIVSGTVRRNGERRQIAWTNKPIRDEYGSLGEMMCIGHDITELKRAEAELRRINESLERKVAERTSELLAKNRQLNHEIKRQKLTEQALRDSEEVYRCLVENIGIGVALISPDMEVLTLNRQIRQWLPDIDLDNKPKCYKVFNIPARDEVCSYCPTVRTLRDGQVHEAVTDTPTRDQIRHFRIVSSPIRGDGGEIVAAIEMVEDITESKRAEEALRASGHKLRTLSARLLQTLEEERKRIAGDLHDSIGQSLMVIKLKVENALDQNRRRGAKAQMVDAMKGLVPNIQDTVEEVRRICTGLRPSLLDDLGLVTTIGWCCRDFRANHPGIAIDQAVDIREDEVPEALKIVIFRIVQEGLNNIAKHSRAIRVHLLLAADHETLALTLTDDGMGFDPAAVFCRDVRQRGLGISGMRERAELSGGRFSIAAAPGQGVSIRAAWPRNG